MTNLHKRILSYSFVIFLATEFLEEVYAEFDISVATNSELFISSLIRTFNHFSLAVGLSGMLILGIRLIRKRGFNLKSILMPILGFLLTLIFIYLSILQYSVLDEMDEILESMPHYENILTSMKKSLERQDLPPDKRAFISKDYARLKYEQEGLVIDYINTEGTVATYKPTVEEITMRENTLKSEVEAIIWNHLGKRSIFNALVFWTLLIISSILVGIFSPIIEIGPHL
jgi:hypothetical protein